jgi:hypothetical protein
MVFKTCLDSAVSIQLCSVFQNLDYSCGSTRNSVADSLKRDA